MYRLEFYFNCLEGRYFCVFEDGIYSVESDIPGFGDKSGELSQEENKLFSDKLNAAKIENWDRYYLPESEGIEDGVKWKVKLIKDDKEYVSEGEESYEPYGYEYFIEALKLIEDHADYFAAKGNDE